jgi:hypothetical protein
LIEPSYVLAGVAAVPGGSAARRHQADFVPMPQHADTESGRPRKLADRPPVRTFTHAGNGRTSRRVRFKTATTSGSPHRPRYVSSGVPLDRQPGTRAGLPTPQWPERLARVSVERVVPDLASQSLEEAKRFYSHVFGLESVMDHGWIVTLADPHRPGSQIS